MASLKRGVRIVVALFSRSRFFRRFGPSIMPPVERVWARLSGGRYPLSGVLVTGSNAAAASIAMEQLAAG